MKPATTRVSRPRSSRGAFSLSLLFLPAIPNGPTQEVRLDRVPGSRAIDTSIGSYAEGFALLPRGFLAEGGSIEVRSSGGRTHPVAFTTRGRYPDGSARSIELKALVPSAAWRGSGALTLVPEPPGHTLRESEGVGSARVVIAEDEHGGLRSVASGGFEARFSQPDGSLLDLLAGGSPWSARGRGSRIEARIDGMTARSELDSINVQLRDRDALSARIEVSGRCAAQSSGGLSFELALEFRAGVPGAEARLRFVPSVDLSLSDLTLILPLDRSRFTRVRVLGSSPGEPLEWAFEDDSSRSIESLDGGAIRVAAEKGPRLLDPVQRCGLLLRGSRGAFGLTVSRMRPLAPKRLVLTGDGELRLEVLPGMHPLEAGIPIVVEFALGASDQRSTTVPADLEWLTRERVRTVARLDPEALPFDSPLVVDALMPNDAVSRCVLAVDREVHSIVGFRDFGDYRLGRGFANLEFDPACAIQLLALGSGDARHATLARDMLRHFATYDLSGGERGTPDGVPWMHGDDHRSFEVEPGHVFLDGLVLAALTGWDDGSVLGRAASGTLALAARSDAFERERDYGWMIRALATLAVTFGADDARSRMRELGSELLEFQAPSGAFRIDRGDSRSGASGAYVVTPWLTALVTTEALHRWRIDAESRADPELPAVRRALSGIAHFLTDIARYPNGEYAASIGLDPTGAEVIEQRGVADPIDRLAIAAGFGRLALAGSAACAEGFEREVAAASAALAHWPPLRANEAARALVALRSIADTRRRLGRDAGLEPKVGAGARRNAGSR